MSSLHVLADILYRAAYLLALAAAPPFLSPEPRPAASPLLDAVVALALLAAVVVGALRVRARLVSKDVLAAAALVVVSVVAAVACAAVFRGARAPLGRGVLYVAVPLWAGLAIIVGAVVERRFGKQRRLSGIIVAAGAGVLLLGGAWGWLFSSAKMWQAAVRKDGGNVTAVDALTRAPMRAHDYPAVMRVLDECTRRQPDACACLARRSDVGIQVRNGAQAVKDARDAVEACPDSPVARAALAAALAFTGEAELAEKEARAVMDKSDDPRLHYALALAYDRAGRHTEALEEAKRAVERGAGRDASLMLGALAINAGDLETAVKVLGPLVTADPNDAEAQYDLALVADKKDNYNQARQGYLAALRADPKLANARYNLALLTLRHGVLEESRHHARKFAEISPGDPRIGDLERMISAAPTKR